MSDNAKKTLSPLLPGEVGARSATGEGSAAAQLHTDASSSSGASRHPRSKATRGQALLPEGEGKISAPRATVVLNAGKWDVANAADRVTLDYEGRHRRRYRYVADGGLEFVLDLKQTTLLHDGDGLQLDDGRIVLVCAATETLVAVTARDTDALIKLAWHIGNRHLPAQLCAERILIRDDAVIIDMLRGLGAEVEKIVAPFTPERGAYAHAHGDHSTAAHPFVFVAGQSNDH